MRPWPLIITAATLAAGSVLPVVASPAPAFSLTLYPAKVIVPLGTPSVDLTLLNSGSQAQHVTVTPADPWLSPLGETFELPPGQTHVTTVTIALPATHDAGDLDSSVAFLADAVGTGTVRARGGVAAVVILETNQGIRHGLSWDSLHVPAIIDPLHGPVILAVRAVNNGNVHETLDPVLGSVGAFPLENVTDTNEQVIRFEPTILLRGTSRILRARWNPPLACWCHVAVRGLEADVLVFPLRASAAAVAVLLGVLYALWHRRRTQ